METPSGVSCFFRKGKIGSWRESLTPGQVERIILDHGEVMRRFGYLAAEGNIPSCSDGLDHNERETA